MVADEAGQSGKHRYWWWLVISVAAGVALTLPSLDGGWVLDDCYHRWVNVGSEKYGDMLPSKWDIFRFADGDEARMGKLMDMGLFSWWTWKGAKGAFWRPVTAATHVLDYTLWPNAPWMMHAHSIAWYAALIACMWLVYRRFMGVGMAAGLATLLFAIDDAHAVPVGMLANRNALVSAFFGMLAIYAHDRWRRDKWRGGAVLGPVFLAVSLLSTEAAMGVVAYLLAYEVTLGEGGWRRRVAALLPYAAVGLIWQLLWRGLGYGVEGVSVYTDPLRHPLRFAELMVSRLPTLFLGQWGPLPSEAHLMMGSGAIYWLALGGAVVAAMLGWVLLPLLRSDRTARFWALGMMLALIPACGMAPMNRQLIFAGIGAMGLLGLLVAEVLKGEPGQGVSRPARAAIKGVAVILVVVHGGLAPAELRMFSRYMVGMSHAAASFDRFPGMDSWTGYEDLIIVNHPVPDHVGHMAGRRDVAGQSVPRRIRTLTSAGSAVEVYRTGEKTLVVRPEAGYLANLTSSLGRDEHHPMSAGEVVRLSGVTITVGELNSDGRPIEARFDFDLPLEDESMQWVYWEQGEFKAFALPAVGQGVRIPEGGVPF